MENRRLPAATAAVLLAAVFLLRPTLHRAAAPCVLPPLALRPAILREIRPDALDLNTATLEELQALPSIGPVRAQNILDHRAQNGPFRRAEELAAVDGISAGILERVRDRICVKTQEELP